MTRWIVLLLCLLPAIGGQAATYYVNRQAPNGGDGSLSNPWNDLADITGIIAGDSVLLERGDVWRESLTFPFNGTSGSRITLGAYGTGADPRLLGSDLMTGWTSSGGTVWQEVDPASTITVAASSVTATAMPQTYDSYVYKDFGAAYFNGDFTQKFNFTITAQSDGSYHGLWMLSNFVDSYNHHQGTGQEADDGLYLLCNRGGAVYHISFRILEDGTIRQYNYDSISLATTYYFTVTRDDDGGTNGTGLVTYYLNTGAYYPGGVNLATVQIHCAVGEQNDYRYCYATHSAHTGAAYTTTAALSNLDLGAGVVDFTEAGGANIWTATLASAPGQVFFDGTRGTKQATVGAVAAQYDWYWAGGVLTTYAASDPDTLYTAPGVEASVRPADRVSGVLRITGDYVTVQDIEVAQSYSRGIEVEWVGATADYVTLDGCTVEWCRDGGIVLPNGLAANVTIEDCNVAYNNTGQIEADTGMEAVSLENVNTFTVRRNLVHDNYREGIDAKYGSANGAIYHNVCYANGYPYPPDYPGIIQIYLDGCTNTNVYQNLVYGGAAAPFQDNVKGMELGIELDAYPTSGLYIYGNVFYDLSEGIRFWTLGGVTSNLSNIHIINNTFYSCAGKGIYFWNPNGNLAAPLTIRNNLFWQDAGNAILDDTTANEGITLATITHNGFALGQSSETKGTDYREIASAGFADLSGHDYALTAGSGFIDYGFAVGSPYDNGLRDSSTWPTNVMTLDHDLYGTAWEIGAYVYDAGGAGFLAWTETGDTYNQITVTAPAVAGAAYNSTGARVWKDFGAGYFGNDFALRWTFIPQWGTWGAQARGYTALADTEGPVNIVDYTAGTQIFSIRYMRDADNLTMAMYLFGNGVKLAETTPYVLSTTTTYYLTLTRANGTAWSLTIRTGSHTGTVVTTIPMTGPTSPALRYMQAWGARNDEGSIASSWTMENLEMTGGAAGTPVPVLHLLGRKRR